MISLIDFVKAFNSNLNYRILIVVDEICDVFYPMEIKNEFIKQVQNHVWLAKIIMFNMSISMLDMMTDYDNNVNWLKMDTVYTLMLITLTTLE